MFKDSWKEDGKPLSIDDYDEETVQNFVDFIYEGRIVDKSKLNIQLLAISHLYQVFAPSPIFSSSYFHVISNFVHWFKGWVPSKVML